MGWHMTKRICGRFAVSPLKQGFLIMIFNLLINKYKVVAIFPSTAFYFWLLFCCETFVVDQF